MYIKNNLVISSYYSNYDLAYKYNLASIYQKPKVTTLIFEISLTNFLSSLDGDGGNSKELDLQLKAFSLFYFWSLVFPFVKNCKLKLVKNKTKELASNYVLKIIFSKNEQIDFFLISIFIENWVNIVNEDIKVFNSKNSSTKFENKMKGNLVNFQLSVPFSVLFDFDIILKSFMPNINSKELNLNLNFVVFTPIFIKQNINLLKNLPLFWISG